MFQLGKTIVSEALFEKDFVCNLSACKGKCCVEGEAGAPLEEEELLLLMEYYPKIRPFLRPEGQKAIEEIPPSSPIDGKISLYLQIELFCHIES